MPNELVSVDSVTKELPAAVQAVQNGKIDARILVSPAVPAAVAAAPTVVTAAATAVASAAAAGNYLATPDILPGVADDVLFTVVDSANRRSWLEIGTDGHPTANSAAIIGSALAPAINAVVAAGTAATGTGIIADGVEMPFAIVDSAGKMALAVHTDGTVDIYKPGAGGVAPASIGLAQLTPAVIAGLSTEKIVSGPDIMCWGDSLTQGQGLAPGGYVTVLAGLLPSHTIRNGGVGGESSTTIAARQGGNPMVVLVTGGVIPASGGVTITFMNINGSSVTPLMQIGGTPGGSFSGSLAGVPGVISLAGGVYTFTRTTPGSAVTSNRPAAFYLDFANSRRGDITIIWVGQNGPSDAQAITDMRAMIEHLNVANKRWLVMSRPTSSDSLDATYFIEFGRRYISPRRYLVDYGLADSGITPSAQDIIDRANGTGVVPDSLRIDAVHLNLAGYTSLANCVYTRLTELGWI